jgi:predicted RNA-binding protein with PUA-like domain
MGWRDPLNGSRHRRPHRARAGTPIMRGDPALGAGFRLAHGHRIPDARGSHGMRHWLMKSEPDEVSIDDLARAPNKTIAWFGVRNYQARNYMRDDMRVGDLAFFYHSSCPEPGIAGIVEVTKAAYPDASQFDRKSPYYDAKSTKDAPRWCNVEVTLREKTPLIALATLRDDPALDGMLLLKRGNRLSITPVEPAHWRHITRLAARTARA